MKIDKNKFLKILLLAGAGYYLIGAITHFFGLTIFPFYDSRLYTPYHDTVIALAAIILALFLITVARNPLKNSEFVNVVILGGVIAIIFSIGILWKINFASLGAPGKKLQTIIELILLIIYTSLLMIFKPAKK